MINDLSRTLKHLLRTVAQNEPQLFPLLQGKVIEFARPDKDYKPNPQGSVCLFLYDIRENRELRSNEPVRVVNSNGQAAVLRPPTRVVCSYLVTAWPAEKVGVDLKAKLNMDEETAVDLNLLEQLLLSEVLQVLARYPTIPASSLQGKLADPPQPVPLPMITAQAEGLNNISEFWTAIGSNLRPSLNVKATISVQVGPPEPEAKPVTERMLEEKPARLEIKGQVNDETHAPIAGARIAIVELDLNTTSDSNGRYTFSEIPIGKYNLLINWRAGEELKRNTLEINVPGGPGSYDLNVTAYDVEGQIKDATEAPLAGATITIVELNLTTTTDDRGHYRFASVPIGNYHLRLSWKVGQDEKSKTVEINVPAAAGAYDVELKG